MLNILLCGCLGKMGKMVTELLHERNDITLIGVDSFIPAVEPDFPVFRSLDDVTRKSDVIIDFSHHSFAMSLLAYVERTKTPAVLSTTGLDETILARMREVAKTVPILHSGNMSVGINLLLSLVKKAASALHEHFDIEIVERHHNKKLDSPSGTALMLANAMNEELENAKTYTYGRYGKDALRKKEEIGIHAVRGGTIVGEHSVIFAGVDEVIEINHRATSRRVFGVGAIKAAEFLIHQQPGLYSMKDVL